MSGKKRDEKVVFKPSSFDVEKVEQYKKIAKGLQKLRKKTGLALDFKLSEPLQREDKGGKTQNIPQMKSEPLGSLALEAKELPAELGALFMEHGISLEKEMIGDSKRAFRIAISDGIVDQELAAYLIFEKWERQRPKCLAAAKAIALVAGRMEDQQRMSFKGSPEAMGYLLKSKPFDDLSAAKKHAQTLNLALLDEFGFKREEIFAKVMPIPPANHQYQVVLAGTLVDEDFYQFQQGERKEVRSVYKQGKEEAFQQRLPLYRHIAQEIAFMAGRMGCPKWLNFNGERGPSFSTEKLANDYVNLFNKRLEHALLKDKGRFDARKIQAEVMVVPGTPPKKDTYQVVLTGSLVSHQLKGFLRNLLQVEEADQATFQDHYQLGLEAYRDLYRQVGEKIHTAQGQLTQLSAAAGGLCRFTVRELKDGEFDVRSVVSTSLEQEANEAAGFLMSTFLRAGIAKESLRAVVKQLNPKEKQYTVSLEGMMANWQLRDALNAAREAKKEQKQSLEQKVPEVKASVNAEPPVRMLELSQADLNPEAAAFEAMLCGDQRKAVLDKIAKAVVDDAKLISASKRSEGEVLKEVTQLLEKLLPKNPSKYEKEKQSLLSHSERITEHLVWSYPQRAKAFITALLTGYSEKLCQDLGLKKGIFVENPQYRARIQAFSKIIEPAIAEEVERLSAIHPLPKVNDPAEYPQAMAKYISEYLPAERLAKIVNDQLEKMPIYRQTKAADAFYRQTKKGAEDDKGVVMLSGEWEKRCKRFKGEYKPIIPEGIKKNLQDAANWLSEQLTPEKLITTGNVVSALSYASIIASGGIMRWLVTKAVDEVVSEITESMEEASKSWEEFSDGVADFFTAVVQEGPEREKLRGQIKEWLLTEKAKREAEFQAWREKTGGCGQLGTDALTASIHDFLGNEEAIAEKVAVQLKAESRELAIRLTPKEPSSHEAASKRVKEHLEAVIAQQKLVDSPKKEEKKKEKTGSLDPDVKQRAPGNPSPLAKLSSSPKPPPPRDKNDHKKRPPAELSDKQRAQHEKIIAALNRARKITRKALNFSLDNTSREPILHSENFLFESEYVTVLNVLSQEIDREQLVVNMFLERAQLPDDVFTYKIILQGEPIHGIDDEEILDDDKERRQGKKFDFIFIRFIKENLQEFTIELMDDSMEYAAKRVHFSSQEDAEKYAWEINQTLLNLNKPEFLRHEIFATAQPTAGKAGAFEVVLTGTLINSDFQTFLKQKRKDPRSNIKALQEKALEAIAEVNGNPSFKDALVLMVRNLPKNENSQEYEYVAGNANYSSFDRADGIAAALNDALSKIGVEKSCMFAFADPSSVRKLEGGGEAYKVVVKGWGVNEDFKHLLSGKRLEKRDIKESPLESNRGVSALRSSSHFKLPQKESGKPVRELADALGKARETLHTAFSDKDLPGHLVVKEDEGFYCIYSGILSDIPNADNITGLLTSVSNQDGQIENRSIGGGHQLVLKFPKESEGIISNQLRQIFKEGAPLSPQESLGIILNVKGAAPKNG